MIEALRVMTYFKISLPTRNWDIAFNKPKTASGVQSYPQVRMLCQMELTSHLLTQVVMDSCEVNEMVLAEQLMAKRRIIA